MDYNDSSDFTIPSQESNILSQSLLMPSSSSNTSSSSTASAGADLSLSELSLVDRPETVRRRPFSLLAQPLASEESAIAEEDDDDGLDETMRVQNAEAARKEAAKTREAKLQQDLFILKKLNAVLETYKGALRETRSNTEVVFHDLPPSPLTDDISLEAYRGEINQYQHLARQVHEHSLKIGPIR